MPAGAKSQMNGCSSPQSMTDSSIPPSLQMKQLSPGRPVEPSILGRISGRANSYLLLCIFYASSPYLNTDIQIDSLHAETILKEVD